MIYFFCVWVFWRCCGSDFHGVKRNHISQLSTQQAPKRRRRERSGSKPGSSAQSVTAARPLPQRTQTRKAVRNRVIGVADGWISALGPAERTDTVMLAPLVRRKLIVWAECSTTEVKLSAQLSQFCHPLFLPPILSPSLAFSLSLSAEKNICFFLTWLLRLSAESRLLYTPTNNPQRPTLTIGTIMSQGQRF